ncbi:MAG: di-trans,poly-cis-decaprenylcistransferase [Candidatus Aenigmarchaeota archaeon]|nr:di-trans,poly-cis-decaprenylcistransferase [Candidatus Aenigmarchaeota archaeon]
MDKTTPNHIGIIMDGNRRFAKRLMIQPWRGHEWGAEKVRSMMEWIKNSNIKELTLYTLSLDNFNRPKKEFDMLMEIFKKELSNEEFKKDIQENNIKINVIGNIKLLPEDIQELLKKTINTTKNNKSFTMNLAIAYSGRQEITDAVKDITEQAIDKKIKIKDINPETINKKLSITNAPDMIIRTGGEKRMSDFLTWQSVYSELFFIDTLWPEFTEDEFNDCIDEFSKRKRRFGK